MKRYLSYSGVVLGMLAAALTGCADEESTSEPEQVKSAITSQGFLTNGCAGTGIFNITSNNLINFVALDQSSFANVNSQLFSMNQQNQQQLIASSQNASALSSAFTSMLDQVSNFTSAFQQAAMLAQQQSSQFNNASATNFNQANSIATVASNSSHLAAGQNTQWTRNNASGFNNAWNSNRANTWANQANQASGFNSANSALFNAIASDAQTFANSGQFANANRGAMNRANSLSNAGSATDATNAINSAASNGANNSAIMNNGVSSIAGGGF